MTDRRRTILWHILRLVIAAGLVTYVIGQANLRDAVRAAPGEPLQPVLRETPDGVVVADPEAGERLIPHAAFSHEGAVRMVGIVSIAGRLAAQWGWALAAVGAMMLQSPVGAVRWQMLLRVQGIRITFLESLRLTYVGWFFNNWMPGATGGDFIKAYYIASQTHQKAEAVTVVFLDRLIGLVAMCMLGAAAVAASIHDERVRVAQIIVGVFLAGALVGGLVFYSRRLRRWIPAGRLFSRLSVWPIISRVDQALFVYRYHKGKILLSIIYSWVTQVVSVLAVWWLATGLGSRATWDSYFVSMPVVWIGWSLIPVPGGFGVAETLAQKLFGPAVLGGGVAMAPAEAATMALAMMLAYRLVQMLVSAPGAVLYLAHRTGVSPAHMREAMESEKADG